MTVLDQIFYNIAIGIGLGAIIGIAASLIFRLFWSPPHDDPTRR